VRAGYYDRAVEEAQQVQASFDDLIAQGRSDIVLPAARLKAIYSVALERTFALEAAIDAIDVAVAALTADVAGDEELRAASTEALVRHRAELVTVTTSTRSDLPRLLGELAADLDEGEGFARQGERDVALFVLENALGRLAWIVEVHDTDEAHDLLGRLCLSLGVIAASSRREMARRAYVLAIGSYGVLARDRGQRAYAEPLAKTYVGLASLFAMNGYPEEAGNILQAMEDEVGAIDRRVRREWAKTGRRLVGEISAARES
jgi:hypothetical protein